MICILTGDIKGSRKAKSKNWLAELKELFLQFGKKPTDWEIYRGDEFQIEIKDCEEALLIAFQIKAFLRTISLDARMSIGIGEKTSTAKRISESNGSAFVYSGEAFDVMKKNKINLVVQSADNQFNKDMNLLIRLGLSFMDNWLAQQAEYVLLAINNPKLSQEEMGEILKINQAAVSKRRKRANFDLMLEINQAYVEKLKML
ncbi:SatD family protein [Flavobacterium psychraquaticum]|uniref:SatD family protein n=1 Tax=Flavobacterium psychraquaticum TaxID=3103958 RepID=UPI002ACEFC4E|nr:SatD family protein [Flavobacterium sp. LB-N7T]